MLNPRGQYSEQNDVLIAERIYMVLLIKPMYPNHSHQHVA